ncbi:hypothetical protein DM01DRAFT_325082 [Hesseltinella vesiculosa]|uniref:Uncharacterized protein n=1 Tax=Hesseltinella vesiculosa TaxID=101127 RepID=A0A1X2GAP7_9FUNG|nr:hypothetical protein DM01DRAFT_325082 [Hesseltinella vesiculosa]
MDTSTIHASDSIWSVIMSCGFKPTAKNKADPSDNSESIKDAKTRFSGDELLQFILKKWQEFKNTSEIVFGCHGPNRNLDYWLVMCILHGSKADRELLQRDLKTVRPPTVTDLLGNFQEKLSKTQNSRRGIVLVVLDFAGLTKAPEKIKYTIVDDSPCRNLLTSEQSVTPVEQAYLDMPSEDLLFVPSQFNRTFRMGKRLRWWP